MAVGAVVGTGFSMLAFAPGVGDIITAQANQLFEGRILTVIDTIRAYRRGDITKSSFYDSMSQNGFTRQNADILYESQFDRLNVTEIINLWFRFKDNENNPFGVGQSWLEERLSQAGIDPTLSNEVVEANRPIPNLDDIIRFAIRDVFEPAQVRQAGLMEDIPPVYINEARKRGLNEQEAGWFWAAHWTLPGITQVYEMLHRLFDDPDPNLKFTSQDMDTFFKLADVAPGYRERLKAISYNPLTRVDVRRMYRIGVFGFGEDARVKLIRAYRELGYNQTNAELMAEFTIKYESEPDREESKNQILQYYREGLWKEDARQQAESLLQELNYNESAIKRMLDFEDLKKIDSEEQSKIDAIKRQYLSGVIPNKSDLKVELNKVGLSFSDIQRLSNQFENERGADLKRLTKSEADRLFQAGIIGASKYREILTFNGYTDSDITLLLRLFEYNENTKLTLPRLTDILAWFEQAVIDVNQFIVYLKELGYRPQDIVHYATASGQSVTIDQVNEIII